MSISNTSNTASPQAVVLADLASRYLIEDDFSLESQLGEAIDALLVEEDEDTLRSVSLILLDKDPEAEGGFWDYARERAEMFLTEEGMVTTLFAIPVLNPDKISGFSADKASAAFVKHGLACRNAQVTFYPAPVDGNHLLNMSPVEIFRLHTALNNDRYAVAGMLGTQEYAEENHPYVCFVGIITYPAQMPGHCLAWELAAEEYLNRVKCWAEHVDHDVLGLSSPGNALGIPGRFVFAVKEGAQEYQELILVEFINNVVAANHGGVLARLTDHPVMDGMTLELYDSHHPHGALFMSWKHLEESRAEVIERVFDLLRKFGVLGIIFDDYVHEESSGEALH